MPKHWGIQFDNRVEKFAKLVAAARMQQHSARAEEKKAERAHKEAEKNLVSATDTFNEYRQSLDRLIELGPDGLFRVEKEDGPELDIRQFFSQSLGLQRNL